MKNILLISFLFLVGCGAGTSFVVKDNMSSECVELANTTPRLGEEVVWYNLDGKLRRFSSDYTVIKVVDENFDFAEERLHLEPGSCSNGLK